MITTTETFSIRIPFPFSKQEALHYCMLSKFESKSAQIYQLIFFSEILKTKYKADILKARYREKIYSI